MKKSIVLLPIAIIAIAVIAFAAGDPNSEAPSIHKVMMARQAWMAAMSKNLDTKNFSAIATDADALAEQTRKIGETHPNPLGKEITLAISALSKDLSSAATAQNGDTVKVKLGEIKAKCGECHAKFR